MFVEKVIEKGLEITIGAAITTVCGALTYSLLSGNKDAKEHHKARMGILTEEYNTLVVGPDEE